jgi:putative transposase
MRFYKNARFVTRGFSKAARRAVAKVLRWRESIRPRWPRSELRQAELGMAVSDIVRQLGISEQTFYRWKKQYAGMQVEGVLELKILQEENARLKKLVAELILDKAILQDVASKKWNGPR